MGLGREVADAYISVHGDLSDFRKDLEGASAAGRQAAIEAADDFSDAWGQRMERQIGAQWHNIVDAMYKNDKVSWERLLGDTSSIDKIDDKFTEITDLMSDMVDEGKMLNEEFDKTFDAMDDIVTKMKARAVIEQQYGEAVKENLARDQLRLRVMTDAHEENKRWARTFEGMTKNNGLAAMEKDFASIAEAARSTDWSKFVKGFDGLDDAAGRVREINTLMMEQGRISHENGIAAAASIDEYVAGEKRLIEEKRRNLDHAAALIEANDRYKRSLDGMVNAHHFARMEQDFKLLASAMASNDWRPIQRMSRDVDDFRARVLRVGSAMRSTGRMSGAAFGAMERQLAAAARQSSQLRVLLNGAGDAAGAFVRRLNLGNVALNLMGRGLSSITGKIKGLSGFNVVGDVFREGGQFIQNLDRNAVKIAKMATLIGALGSVAVSSLGGAVTVMGDLSAAVAGLATAAPAFLIGAAIGGGVLIAAFKDMSTVLADLKPAFAALQNTISTKFWDQAAKPIRDMVTDLMPTLTTQLGNTGTAFGKMFGKLATAVKAVPKKDLETMFDRMNKGIAIAGDAMAPLTRAFVNLGLAGSKTFERFGTWIVKVSDQFDAFIQKAADNGDLDKWINTGIEGMKDLGRAIGGAAGMFAAIDKAARDAGSNGLDGFANSLEKISAVMNGERFQGSLKTFFEAFYIGLDGVKQGFLNLAPGVESFLPVLKEIMGSMAEVFAKIGTIASTFLANKELQDGMKAFADGISQALDKLMPAIGPMATSLGKVFDLMAAVLPTITDLIAKIAVTWGPIFDRLLETLKPLIGPLTEFAKTLVDTLAPVFSKFVDEVLPPLVQLFKDLLPVAEGFVKLFTPVVNSLLEGAATQFKGMSDALKEFNTHAGPAGERMGEIIKKMETVPKVNTGQGHWIDSLFTFSAAAVSVSPTLAFISKQFDKLTLGVRENWSRFTTGLSGLANPEEMVKKLLDFSISVAVFEKEVNAWFEENIFRNLRDLGASIGKLWDETLGKFFNDVFGGDQGASGVGGGGGGVGGKGMGVTGKLDPAMLGLPDEENTRSWFEDFGTWLWEGFTGALGRLAEALGLNTFVEDWNLFWDTLPVKVQETWDAIVLWVQTKAAEIKLAIDTFILDTQTNWALFWDAVPVKVQETWDAVLLWITTKIGEIKLAIDTWIADTKLNWDNFWTGVRTKVEETWNAVKTWIDTKVTEIKTGIDTFITDTRTNWDTFWNGVKTKVEEVWKGVKDFIDTKTREIKTGIENFGRDVKTNWDNFWRDIGDKVRTGWDDIVRNFQTGVDRAVEWVRSLPGKVVAAIGNGFTLLAGQGAAIMDGFLNGLSGGKWTEVKNFVGRVAQWIADNKGPISYDKVLLIPAGKAIMDGLGVGLRSQLPALKDTLDAVTDTMTDAITETFAKSKMYIAGASAALGLADGLKDNTSKVLGAFGALLPPEASVAISAAGNRGVGGSTPQIIRNITIEKGAVEVTTPTKDPELVASSVIDRLVINSNL